MSIVSSIKSESQQNIELFYFGSGEVAAIPRDIKRISNESKNPKYDAGPVVKNNESEVLNPLYKSCKVETESSLYDSAPVENYRNIHSESRKSSESKNINRDDEISVIEEIIEGVNSSIEFIPNTHVFTQSMSETKTINKDDEISEIKEIVEEVNSGIEVIPNIHVFAAKILEAKSKAVKLVGDSKMFTSPPPSFTEFHEINPRNSILIPADHLFKIMASLNDFCEKSTFSSDKQHSE